MTGPEINFFFCISLFITSGFEMERFPFARKSGPAIVKFAFDTQERCHYNGTHSSSPDFVADLGVVETPLL